MNNNIELVLKNNLEILKKSRDILNDSFDVCKRIHNPETFDELESVEAFTARFARTVDILTNKVLKSYLIYLGEDIKTFIDSANFLEKIGILESADDIMLMKRMRNEISHDYTEDELNEIFVFVFKQTPKLFEIIDRIEKEIEKYID